MRKKSEQTCVAPFSHNRKKGSVANRVTSRVEVAIAADASSCLQVLLLAVAK